MLLSGIQEYVILYSILCWAGVAKAKGVRPFGDVGTL